MYHTLSLTAAPREGHFLWPASSTGFLFHFQHGKVVIPSQADACVCLVSVQEKGWKDREQWHHKLDARESGLHLPRPPIACPCLAYRPSGTRFSCPWGSTALQDRKVCVCVSGAGGGSLMLFLSHSIWDACSFVKVRGESNAKIMWRCWVKVKNNTLDEFIRVFILFYWNFSLSHSLSTCWVAEPGDE